MASALTLIIGIAALVLLIALVWRFSSIRASLPCPAWLSWMVELDNPLFRNNRAQVIIDNSAVHPGMKVLDFGCGPGRLTLPLARLVGDGGEVTALDLQPGMLQRLREKAEAEGIGNIKYILGAAGQGILPDNRYDSIFLVTVLGEIPDKVAALKEIFDSLKEKGTLSVTEVIADPHFLRQNTVRHLAKSAGFVEKSFFGKSISYTVIFEKNEKGTSSHLEAPPSLNPCINYRKIEV